MAIEVPCPNCQSVLRAPEDAAGKRVKCKKCDHRFLLPGSTEKPDSVSDSQALSVIDQPMIPVQIAPPITSTPSNAFAFDAGGGDGEGEAAPVVQIRSRTPAKAKSGGAGKWVLILGLLGVMLLLGVGGGAAAVYFLLLTPTQVPTASSSKPEEASPRTRREVARTDRKSEPTGNETLNPVKPIPVNPLEPITPASTGAAGKSFTMPGPPAVVGKIIAAPKLKIPLEIPTNSIRDIVFIPSNPPLIGVLWNSSFGFQGQGIKDTVDVYSARTMIRVSREEYPVEATSNQLLFDLGPDGNLFAAPVSRDKILVHSLESKSKILDNFNPFQDAAMKRTSPPSAVRFASPNNLFVFDARGALDVWDLTSKQKISSSEPLLGSSGRVFVTEPAEGKLLAYAGGAVHPLSAAGQKAGAPIPVGGEGFQALGIGLDAAGTRAAVVYQSTGKPLYGLAVLDLRKSAITGQVALPDRAGIPADAGCFGNGAQAMVITNNRTQAFLYDAESDTMAAYFTTPANKPAAKIFSDGFSGQICWVVPDPADAKKSLLLGVEANFDGYPALVDEARAGKKPVGLSLRADGLAK